MVDVGLFKEKTKVLTSAKSREARTVDPKMQISTDEYREIRKRHDQLSLGPQLFFPADHYGEEEEISFTF